MHPLTSWPQADGAYSKPPRDVGLPGKKANLWPFESRLYGTLLATSSGVVAQNALREGKRRTVGRQQRRGSRHALDGRTGKSTIRRDALAQIAKAVKSAKPTVSMRLNLGITGGSARIGCRAEADVAPGLLANSYLARVGWQPSAHNYNAATGSGRPVTAVTPSAGESMGARRASDVVKARTGECGGVPPYRSGSALSSISAKAG